MNNPQNAVDGPNALDVTGDEEIIVVADEVDDVGANISTITAPSDEDLEARVEARRQEDLGKTEPKLLANDVAKQGIGQLRPILRRESSGPPPPPMQPPPPAPGHHSETANPNDSLTLVELRNIVGNLPKLEPIAYAYTHKDTRTFPEELEEWFQYTQEDRLMLKGCYEAFKKRIAFFEGQSPSVNLGHKWLEMSQERQELFIKTQIEDLQSLSGSAVTECLECLAYIALGAWKETAVVKEEPTTDEETDFEPPNDKYRNSIRQLRCIEESAEQLCQHGAVQVLYDVIGSICDNDHFFDPSGPIYTSDKLDDRANQNLFKDRQLNAALAIFYFVLESGRKRSSTGGSNFIRFTFTNLEPNLLHYLGQLVARIRWDDNSNIPLTRILLLLWKATLLIFGGTQELADSKRVLGARPETTDDKKDSFLTASPLDYHIFRQEITSKYPAYNPPPPLIPIEPNNSTILPPLPNHPSRSTSHDSLFSAAGTTNAAGKSIFHQPVHISTPAPSPPPSPAGPGGKGGKKQNYQTNQNFPFLYPPLDGTSTQIGGKGSAGLQDRLVGRHWEGSDIPASILEAGQLFASRMRMTRSLRQLWDVREDYIKSERGWKADGESESFTVDEMDELKLSDHENDTQDEPAKSTAISSRSVAKEGEVPSPSKETENEDVQGRLNAIEKFYDKSLPHLQSIVIVLLKVVLSNVTSLGNHAPAPHGPEINSNITPNTNEIASMPKNNINLARQLSGVIINGHAMEIFSGVDPVLEDLNAVRTREVTSKAVVGFLLILLKWLKLSHILKFEYFTQLLLDSNYLPLALKFFALQDVDRAVDNRSDRDDFDFFSLCYIDAGGVSELPEAEPPAQNSPESFSSEDEAQPPPVLRNRPSPPASPPPSSPKSSPSPPRRPEVDELGYPTTTLPQSPLTTYSPRFFHTTICHLRILQKLTKRHAHRALLLVQYKSSTILRRNLKIPQPELRLYTLKLFKSQVPYCGRKWRQTNMRVITAIYLHCRMELRDEWISGGALDEWVEEAVPIERGWRALGWWWHSRNYRDSMGLEKSSKDDDDFFVRELEKMGWCWQTTVDGDDDLEDASPIGTEWEGSQLEAW